ncbi:hypothetical protein XELAEV_18016875mg [Xenopus laevis]|uniref:Uncharacterized protein n=1 Tax=Xenopus laevis TaxID=8355 RepID=A0A974HSF5_XENLA|nr:hypothetical protein XELAEV_18016875mg [Xenopus laevis]
MEALARPPSPLCEPPTTSLPCPTMLTRLSVIASPFHTSEDVIPIEIWRCLAFLSHCSTASSPGRSSSGYRQGPSILTDSCSHSEPESESSSWVPLSLLRRLPLLASVHHRCCC